MPSPFPSWHPHPDVWLLVGRCSAAGYASPSCASARGTRPPGRPPVTRLQVICFALGVFAIWLAADWPMHDIAERYNLQRPHGAAPGADHGRGAAAAARYARVAAARWILRPPWLFRAVRWMSRFLPALIVFNLVLVLTHWPAVVDLTLAYGLAHFLVHA